MRDSFVFYRSFYSSMKSLNKTERLKLYDAITEYALDDVETDDLTGTLKIIYDLVKPLIDANNRKYKNGLKGGRPKDEESPTMKFPDIDHVIITEAQYKKACEKFKEDVVLKAISILDSWLAKNGKTQQQYLGRNHYGFFKSDNWTIKEAQKAINEAKTNWSV